MYGVIFEEFWPFYVSQHLNPVNRRLHFYGTALGLALGASAIAARAPWLAGAGLVAGYGFAWIGHYFHEKNRPATFAHPLLSIRGDLRMFWLTLRGEMDTEILMLTTELKRLGRRSSKPS